VWTLSTSLRIWRLGVRTPRGAHNAPGQRPGLFADFEQLVAAHGAVLLRPDRAGEPRRVGRRRRWIESTFDTLKTGSAENATVGRTLPGVVVRVAQRLALAAAIWWNWEIGAPDKRSCRRRPLRPNPTCWPTSSARWRA
jgi:hypothetical protein